MEAVGTLDKEMLNLGERERWRNGCREAVGSNSASMKQVFKDRRIRRRIEAGTRDTINV